MGIEELQDYMIPIDYKELQFSEPSELTYWKLRKNRTFFIDYEIDDDYRLIELTKIIIQMNIDELSIPKDELKPIYIYIHTFGGDSYQCNSFKDVLLTSRIPIVTIALGTTMSAGFEILLAGTRRYVFNHSQLMVHNGYFSVSGSALEVEEAQKAYKKQLDASIKYVLERTDIPKQLFNKNKNKDWYLTIDEVKKYNVAIVIENFEDIK